MSRIFNLRYNDVDFTDTEVTLVNNKEENYSYIDIHSSVFARTFGKMVKELTNKTFPPENFMDDIIDYTDRFIEDVAEINSLRKWLWEEKMLGITGEHCNKYKLYDDSVMNDEIIPYVRQLHIDFVKKWSDRFYGKLTWSED